MTKLILFYFSLLFMFSTTTVDNPHYSTILTIKNAIVVYKYIHFFGLPETHLQ